MSEIKVNGQAYRIGKLPAMQQFHVARKLGPALVICGVTAKMVMEGAKVTLDDWMAVAGPVMEVVSQMSDADVEFVIYTCLRTVQRQSGDRFADLVVPGENRLMFQDLDMAEMLRLTVEVLRINLANFAKGMTADGSSTEGSGAATP